MAKKEIKMENTITIKKTQLGQLVVEYNDLPPALPTVYESYGEIIINEIPDSELNEMLSKNNSVKVKITVEILS